jgi:hypothetical protein
MSGAESVTAFCNVEQIRKRLNKLIIGNMKAYFYTKMQWLTFGKE